jgi:hypothetical protein
MPDLDMEMGTIASEATPLLSGTIPDEPLTRREHLYQFLEAKTPAGKVYEKFTMLLILSSVISFITASLFVEEYNDAPWAARNGGLCNNLCDALWFGNYADNGLEVLSLGTTSILEIFIVFVFSVDYLCRVYTADLESEVYAGFWGRVRYLPTFYSLVDLASTVPFYLDAFVLRHSDLVASQFLRMFRLFRMMRVEGRYDTALTMFDDVFYAQRGILGTALFVGVTTWMTVSSLYYLVERRSADMIYCGAAPDYCGDGDDIDVSLCTINSWGITDCSAAGCPSSDEYPEPCYNLYKSIPMASYYSLLNLFGEFPLIDQHNAAGKVVGTFVAIVAVAVFALPAGIIGNGFEDLIAKRRLEGPPPVREDGGMTIGFAGSSSTKRGRMYNFLYAETSWGSKTFANFVSILILGTALTFMFDTVSGIPSYIHIFFDVFELFSVIVFTVEYVLRVYAAKEDPKYNGKYGRLSYMTTFLPIVDFLAVAPYWLEVALTGKVVISYSDASGTGSNLVKSLRLLRMLRFERYTHAFTSFDDVIYRNRDVLTVTAFTAVLFWILFGAILYYTERENPDSEMAGYYKTVPDSMWVTLLNLSGESPLSQYTLWGKIITGIIGLFATGLFGIPIGVLGAGFEELIEEENEDTPDDVGQDSSLVERAASDDLLGISLERRAYRFVNGIGSQTAFYFEMSIYSLIMLTVSVGIWQTVDGHESEFNEVEWFAVVVFTVEYLMRFFGAAADPYFRKGRSGFTARLKYVFSFYSIIDLLAIVPFYVAVAMPDSWVNDYDEYLRMFRLLRLIKLDKYIPSITLVDDVFRLKRNSLIVAGYAAWTLWILFAGLIYLTEHKDDYNGIDNVPSYGCDSDCTMMDRFQTFFDSLIYTGVHLTGDYPIITYTWPARFVCVLMVLAAVGVVSVPSGLLASGFVEIVQSKAKARRGDTPAHTGRAGDDWYEFRLAQLEGQDPPPSLFGPTVDRWQFAVNEFLNGKEGENGHTTWTRWSRTGRIFIFTVIIANVVAVIAESIPEVDRFAGNAKGNFFDRFEFFSVMVFALEYFLRLFCAPKNKEALFSTFVYATTFFGIVDFLSTAPWFFEQGLIHAGLLDASGDNAKIFRMFRIFRILQLEDFIVAFSKLDNVFRASKDVLKATGLMALIIWIGCGALFYIFEENNPNWRSCDKSIPARSDDFMGCFDFSSTRACNDVYPGLCTQAAFTNIPNSLFFTAVFLVGEWGVIDFSWPGRIVCLFLCVVGIALYAIPTGTLFDSFGAVLGMVEEEEEEEDEDKHDGDNDKVEPTGITRSGKPYSIVKN